MKHYVCTGGCGGVSDTSGYCQAEHCVKHNQSLIECNCTDNTHPGLIGRCEKCGKLCKEKGGCDIEPYKEELE